MLIMFCSRERFSQRVYHIQIRIVEQPFGIAPSGAWKQYLQYDIEICEIHTDLNVADPLTKIISQSKHDHTLVLLGISHMAMRPVSVNHMAM